MINVQLYRKKVQNVIDKTFPTFIELKRKAKIEDEYKDWKESEIDVVSKNGFLSTTESSTNIKTFLQALGKVVKDDNFNLMLAADDSFQVLKDDYFEVEEKKYTVISAYLQFNIYWEVSLEVVE